MDLVVEEVRAVLGKQALPAKVLPVAMEYNFHQHLEILLLLILDPIKDLVGQVQQVLQHQMVLILQETSGLLEEVADQYMEPTHLLMGELVVVDLEQHLGLEQVMLEEMLLEILEVRHLKTLDLVEVVDMLQVLQHQLMDILVVMVVPESS